MMQASYTTHHGVMPTKSGPSRIKDLTFKARNSPYIHRTPRVREIFLRQPQFDLSDGREDRTVTFPDVNNDIICKSFHVYKVTALYNFSYNKNKLREYARYITSSIEKEKKNNIGVLVGQATDYKVSVSVINGLDISKDDHKAIKITIVSKTAKENAKPLFTGFLTSAERKVESWETAAKAENFTILPLFLASGKQIFIKSIVKFLETKFSCIVLPLKISSFNLTWMLAMWAGTKPEFGSKPLFLEYSLPIDELRTIQYSLSSASAVAIWNRIHDENSNEMDVTEVEAFISCLEKHFLNLFSINLAHLHLVSIGTPAAAIHRNGMVKILASSALPFVLRHLTRLAQELSVC